MTSNIGSQLLLDERGKSISGENDTGGADDNIKNTVMAELKRNFRPEFLNRVDEIVVFDPLGKEQIRRIASLQTRGLVERLQGMHINVEIDDSALDLVAQKGYDPVYGARPLKRVIQKEIETPVSKMLIAGELADGGKLKIIGNNGKIDFSAASI
jgi:ATP-dependent Clp protease ATP-binding subunit ClpB